MPLQHWNCDVCHDPLSSDPNDGLVVWRDRRVNNRFEYFDFKIVHKTILDAPEPRRCDPGSAAGYSANLDLDHFLGPNGLAMLLSWLSPGPIKGGDYSHIAVSDLNAYVDFVRRVQTPFYEEARPRLSDENTLHWLGDANEYYPYLPDTLRRVTEDTLGS
ncbi:hypothetical protein ACIRG5_28420 [Lentzea sp. NPDC102401]|uniref:hypothetical protein n=1 Tax=Lentzea sp. NPDC102401 TaxID=3364128 RepID=UPI0038217506